MSLAAWKVPTVLEYIDSLELAKEPVLVFSAHSLPLDAFQDRPGWRLIRGDVALDERAEANRLFQAGELAGLALTIQAGGTALTLTRSANVFFIDKLYTPALNEQAIDRAVRIGQTRGVLVTNFVADHPLDAHLLRLTTKKESLIDATMRASANP